MSSSVEDGAISIGAHGARGPLAEIERADRAQRTRELLAKARTTDGPHRDQLHQEIVVLNCRVADAVANRFRDRGVPVEDLRQAAYEGLVKAVRRYDPETAEDLLTYAVPTIRGEVQRHLRDQRWMVRPPRSAHQGHAQLLAATEQLTEDLGREPTVEEVCEALGWDRSQHDEVLTAMTQVRHASLDRPVDPGAGPDGTTLGDLVDLDQHGHLGGQDDLGHDALSLVETRLLLEPALGLLSVRERQVVELRFVEQCSQADVARILGMTHKQVTHTLDRAIGKLRRALGDAAAPAG